MSLLRPMLMPLLFSILIGATFAQDNPRPAMPSIPLGGEAASSPVAAADAQTSPAASAPGGIANYAGKKFSHGPRSKPRVTLTFDDGPSPKLTPQVLEILKQNNIHATFFMLGEMVQKSPALAKAVADAGMEVGSHSITHANLAKLSAEKVQHEIVDAAKTVAEATGQPQHLFRPPYGNINQNVTKIARENGLVLCLWSVDTLDWAPGATPEKIAAAVAKQTNNGSVILMHDIHPKTIEALPEVIKLLKEKGFEFVTLGEMIAAAAAEPPDAAGAGAGKEAPPPKPLSISLDESSSAPGR